LFRSPSMIVIPVPPVRPCKVRGAIPRVVDGIGVVKGVRSINARGIGGIVRRGHINLFLGWVVAASDMRNEQSCSSRVVSVPRPGPPEHTFAAA